MFEFTALKQVSCSAGPGGGDVIDRIAEALATDGYVVVPDALPGDLTDRLFLHFQTVDRDSFHKAGIGREEKFHRNRFVRTDRVHWLDGTASATNDMLQWMETLRTGLNRRLFLGLFDYECHYALYPKGAYYKRHVDAFRGERNRVVTTVFYLNPNWTPADGGELLIYRDDALDPVQTVMPTYGTLVVFLSEDFPHEVLPTERSRFSVAGWFRVNPSVGNGIDPPR